MHVMKIVEVLMKPTQHGADAEMRQEPVNPKQVEEIEKQKAKQKEREKQQEQEKERQHD